MKKQLLGTTTLVAAGLLVAGAPGQEAFAAEPITVGFGGNYTAAVVFWDQGDTGGGLRDHAIEDTGEIQFSGSTDLDNGINVGVRIEYEAFNSGSGASGSGPTTIVDDTYIAFSGGFGLVRFGSNANVASAMHYENPSGAWEFSVNSPSHAVISGAGNAMTSFIGTYQFTSGDQEGIFYYTPRMNGFQLGVSYQPDNLQTAGPTATGSGDTTAGAQDNVWAFGLNYQGSFETASISASAGYLTGSEESSTAAGEGTRLVLLRPYHWLGSLQRRRRIQAHRQWCGGGRRSGCVRRQFQPYDRGPHLGPGICVWGTGNRPRHGG